MITDGADGAEIARAFVEARRSCTPLDAFPGTLPEDIDAAYAIQHAAIAQWPDRVAGWKVGRISGDLEAQTGINRFIGPIFGNMISIALNSQVNEFPVIAGGFAALEVELIAVVGQDQGAITQPHTPETARGAIAALHVGIEVAGSPLAPIHTLGPLASIAGFGNNMGLIIGPPIPDFASRPLDGLTARTRVDGALLRQGSADGLPGGIWAAVAFALNLTARFGRPMRVGDVISTGALTGVHPIEFGSRGVADFGADGLLEFSAVLQRAR